MPIKSCKRPEGGDGFQWGSGKCYRNRADAEKQAAAAHAHGYTGDELAFDRASVRTYDEDGRMHVALTHISKANVCPYYGNEIPGWEQLGLQSDKVYQLYRDPAELEKAASTFNNLPILSEHVPVSAKDHRPELVIGSTGTDAVFNAPYLDNSLVIWADDAIDGIENDQQRELSCAYYYVADMTPGVIDNTPYDGVMRDIRGNHMATVAIGRTGSDVMVGDSTLETATMKKPLSRKAMLAKGALVAFLRPRLAADQQIDLNKILKDVAADNWKQGKAAIVAAVTAAASGKLAKDANMEGVIELLDALDPAAGETAEHEAEGLTEDEEATYQDLAKRRKPGANDETEEEKKKKLEAEKKAQDEAKEKEMKEGKAAMDAAISKATTATEQSTVKRMLAIRAAERMVRPHVGELVNALDTPEAIYKLALDAAKVDVTGVPPTAYEAMVRMLPIPGSTKPRDIATDSSVAAGLAKRFPNASRIRIV